MSRKMITSARALLRGGALRASHSYPLPAATSLLLRLYLSSSSSSQAAAAAAAHAPRFRFASFLRSFSSATPTTSGARGTSEAAAPLPAYKSLATATADGFTLQDGICRSPRRRPTVCWRAARQAGGTFLHELDLLEHSLRRRRGPIGTVPPGARCGCAAARYWRGPVPGQPWRSRGRPVAPLSAENHWLLLHHEVYQAHYYAGAMCRREGMKPIDPDLRTFQDHPCHLHTVHFCEKYDQTSFDPLRLTAAGVFEPMVRRILHGSLGYTGDAQQEPAIAKAELASTYPVRVMRFRYFSVYYL